MKELIGKKVRRIHPCVGELVVGGEYTITNVDPRLPPRITIAGDDTWFLFDAFELVKCHWACTGCDTCGSKGHGNSWF